MTLTFSTLTSNSAASGGGGLYKPGGSLFVMGTIVADSPSGGNCAGDSTSGGYNLSSDMTSVFSSTGDLHNTNPLLGPLQNNGGSTLTMRPWPGSPVIGVVPAAICPATDQRGVSRPQNMNGLCDEGAVEAEELSHFTYVPMVMR